MLTVTESLLIALLVAAFVGACIGWLARRIIAIRNTNFLIAQNNIRLQLVNDEVQLLRSEETRMQEELSKTKAMVSSYEKAARESVKQATEFASTIKRKDQRVVELEAQVLASEEQHMRVQRDFAKLRLSKTREVQQLRQQLSDRVADTGQVEIQLSADTVEDLPVLQRKNETAQLRAALTGEPVTELTNLFDLSTEILDTDEDVLDMTSDFDFEAAESMLNEKEKRQSQPD